MSFFHVETSFLPDTVIFPCQHSRRVSLKSMYFVCFMERLISGTKHFKKFPYSYRSVLRFGSSIYRHMYKCPLHVNLYSNNEKLCVNQEHNGRKERTRDESGVLLFTPEPSGNVSCLSMNPSKYVHVKYIHSSLVGKLCRRRTLDL